MHSMLRKLFPKEKIYFSRQSVFAAPEIIRPPLINGRQEVREWVKSPWFAHSVKLKDWRERQGIGWYQLSFKTL